MVYVIGVGDVGILDSLLTEELILKDDSERFVVVDGRRKVGGVIDAVVGVVKVADLERNALQRPNSVEAAEEAVAVDHAHEVVAVILHPSQARGVEAVLREDRVLQQLTVAQDVHLLQNQRKGEVCVGVSDARAVRLIGQEHRRTNRDTRSQITVKVGAAQVAGTRNVVPSVAIGTPFEALGAQKVGDCVCEALRTRHRCSHTRTAGNVAKVAGLGAVEEELTVGTLVETVGRCVGEEEAHFADSALQVCESETLHAFEGAGIAPHKHVVESDVGEVVKNGAVAGVVRHICHEAIGTGIRDAGAVEEI